MTTFDQLASKLHSIDQKNYSIYKSIKGSYSNDLFKVIIDHVQGDSFAAPSKFRIIITQDHAQFPKNLYNNQNREIALKDFLTRQFGTACKKYSKATGSGKGGVISIDQPTQQILNRTSAFINDKQIEVRFLLSLPADGRRILGREAAKMICEYLPAIVSRSLLYKSLDSDQLKLHIDTYEDTSALRNALAAKNLVSFIANDSILARISGVDDKPLSKKPVPFQSPKSLETTIDTPNKGPITGMGVPTGISLIVGGGYHGKSTLLRAIELGIYNHIPGDGREFVVTISEAVKIRSEDKRSVSGVNISTFINNLPGNQTTQSFSTMNASGSTSQAANIMEALEVGTKLLLLDEDTSATNFMIRDRRMQELISKDKEPITPFSDKVLQIYKEKHISTILVMGGCGDYFDSADNVIAMEEYRPKDVTKEAKDIATRYSSNRLPEHKEAIPDLQPRYISPESITLRKGHRPIHTRTKNTDEITIGQEDIDLSQVEQLTNESQTRAIAAAIVYLKQHLIDTNESFQQLMLSIEAKVEKDGLQSIIEVPDGNLAQFRRFELAAAINRLRTLVIRPES